MAVKRILYRGYELLPPKYDLVFKALFTGDGDLELLASLLSCILDENIHAKDMLITNSGLPQTHESGKAASVDVRIKLTDGKHINVEIQLRNKYNMANRSIYYISRLYVDQMVVKMDFSELCPAIAINILDFDFLPYEEYHNTYRLKNTKNNDELTAVFEINFIELGKVTKDSNKLKDLWMRFLSATSEKELDMLAKENPIFEKAINKLLYVSADEKLRYELDMREKAELDYWSAMKTSFKEGKAEGIAKGIEEGIAKGKAEGREEGRAEGKEEGRAVGRKEGIAEGREKGIAEGIQEGCAVVARKMLRRNRPIDEIIEYTGLTREEIEGLRGTE